MRFRNVGKAMLAALEAKALRRGLKEVVLSSTLAGPAFYLRHGYIDDGPGESAFGLQSRRMHKTLTPPPD